MTTAQQHDYNHFDDEHPLHKRTDCHNLTRALRLALALRTGHCPHALFDEIFECRYCAEQVMIWLALRGDMHKDPDRAQGILLGALDRLARLGGPPA